MHFGCQLAHILSLKLHQNSIFGHMFAVKMNQNLILEGSLAVLEAAHASWKHLGLSWEAFASLLRNLLSVRKPDPFRKNAKKSALGRLWWPGTGSGGGSPPNALGSRILFIYRYHYLSISIDISISISIAIYIYRYSYLYL